MSWLRQAGGVWVDPEGKENKVDSHGDWAWKLYLNQFISEEEQTEPVVEDKPLAGPKVEYKGTGGAEAKAEAEKRMQEMGITSPLVAANKLLEDGWVRISMDDPACPIVQAVDYEHLMIAEEAVIRAAAGAELISISTLREHESLFIMSSDLSLGLKAAIEKARAKGKPVQTSGLGSWGLQSKPEIQFTRTIVHSPTAAVGKQWVVLDDKGKKVAEGPSRKWAERSASRLGWFKRQKSR